MESELRAEIARPQRLLIESADFRGKRLDVAFAPFDYVNPAAQIVIVGLTPGRQQMANALLAASRSLKNGNSEAEAMREAKTYASFSGPMRANLVAMLDSIGVNHWLGISTTGLLWEADAHRVQFTSVLRYPVFVAGANYSGAPAPLSSPLLRRQLLTWFTSELPFCRMPSSSRLAAPSTRRCKPPREKSGSIAVVSCRASRIRVEPTPNASLSSSAASAARPCPARLTPRS
jgi:hypothetical protein